MNRDFPDGSASEESACNGEDLSLIPGLGRPLWEGNGNPIFTLLQQPGTKPTTSKVYLQSFSYLFIDY